MSKCLLDTNIIIDFFRGDKIAVDIVTGLQNEQLFISVITIAEFYQGAVRASNPQKSIENFNGFILDARIQSIPVDQEVAQIYGLLQGEFHKKGKAKPILDLFIAASCIAYNLTLVTFDKKDFTDFKKLKIFKT